MMPSRIAAPNKAVGGWVHILDFINDVTCYLNPQLVTYTCEICVEQGLALLTLSWDKNWDSHSLVNGYPSFYPRIALVAPSPGVYKYVEYFSDHAVYAVT